MNALPVSETIDLVRGDVPTGEEPASVSIIVPGGATTFDFGPLCTDPDIEADSTSQTLTYELVGLRVLGVLTLGAATMTVQRACKTSCSPCLANTLRPARVSLHNLILRQAGGRL